jgi:hypothetical protein
MENIWRIQFLRWEVAETASGYCGMTSYRDAVMETLVFYPKI